MAKTVIMKDEKHTLIWYKVSTTHHRERLIVPIYKVFLQRNSIEKSAVAIPTMQKRI